MKDFLEALRAVLIGTLAVFVIFICVAAFADYQNAPHPKVRAVVTFQNGGSIVTVDGVSDEGWLKDCDTGLTRHISGSFTINHTAPIVCFGEPHYQEGLQGK